MTVTPTLEGALAHPFINTLLLRLRTPLAWHPALRRLRYPEYV
jgi:hypothetical protein